MAGNQKVKTVPTGNAQTAFALHENGVRLSEAGNEDGALKEYLKALALDDKRADTHYNAGLVYKYRGQWKESLEHNRRAVELDPKDEASNWNLAIAATALRDWRVARAVWHRLGLPIEEGDQPIEANFGMTPVRLNPEGEGEVVWAQRIDPVRAQIMSIPYPQSGFRHGDVVLHDGAAVGYRKSRGRDVPVFNVLKLFSSSRQGTYEVDVRISKPEDIEALEKLCEESSLPVEDWTTMVAAVCKHCSEGTPHEHHDRDLESEWQNRHRLGIASDDEAKVQQVLKHWQEPGRQVLGIELALSPKYRH